MSRLLPYLQLMRLPALFTAWADCFAGLVLTHGAIEPMREFVLLIAATTGLYLAGMVFNDVFDRAVDAEERPQRPIPSGKVPLRNAVALGGLLMGGGLVAAAVVGRDSLILAGILAGCILLYDGGLKKTLLGPVAMGSCRFFNVLLGASAIGAWHSIWTRPQLVVAAGISIYIVGVTLFARSEATTSDRKQLIAGTLIANAGIATLVALIATWWGPATSTTNNILIVFGVIALILNRRWWQAVFDPQPKHVQIGVVGALWSLILIDGVLIFYKTGDPYLAGATVALLIPTLVLGKWIPMT